MTARRAEDGGGVSRRYVSNLAARTNAVTRKHVPSGVDPGPAREPGARAKASRAPRVAEATRRGLAVTDAHREGARQGHRRSVAARGRLCALGSGRQWSADPSHRERGPARRRACKPSEDPRQHAMARADLHKCGIGRSREPSRFNDDRGPRARDGSRRLPREVADGFRNLRAQHVAQTGTQYGGGSMPGETSRPVPHSE